MSGKPKKKAEPRSKPSSSKIDWKITAPERRAEIKSFYSDLKWLQKKYGLRLEPNDGGGIDIFDMKTKPLRGYDRMTSFIDHGRLYFMERMRDPSHPDHYPQ